MAEMLIPVAAELRSRGTDEPERDLICPPVRASTLLRSPIPHTRALAEGAIASSVPSDH